MVLWELAICATSTEIKTYWSSSSSAASGIKCPLNICKCKEEWTVVYSGTVWPYCDCVNPAELYYCWRRSTYYFLTDLQIATWTWGANVEGSFSLGIWERDEWKEWKREGEEVNGRELMSRYCRWNLKINPPSMRAVWSRAKHGSDAQFM